MVSEQLLLVALAVAVILLPACRSIVNYEDQNQPVFNGSYAGDPPAENGEIKVITWNIAFAEEIDKAIEELTEVEELQEADILLLQEMDEEGVEAIAKALKYNFVYYPASVHNHHDQNFGNAVLSKWPISDSEKLILPYHNPKNDQIRIAVKALIAIGDFEVPVYSVHTETFWLSQSKRGEQIDSLAEDVEPANNLVILGGDFNTLTPGSINALEERLALLDLERVSAGAGPTVEVAGVRATLDHIFARGFSVVEAGVWEGSEASDHVPLWVTLTPHDLISATLADRIT